MVSVRSKFDLDLLISNPPYIANAARSVRSPYGHRNPLFFPRGVGGGGGARTRFGNSLIRHATLTAYSQHLDWVWWTFDIQNTRYTFNLAMIKLVQSYELIAIASEIDVSNSHFLFILLAHVNSWQVCLQKHVFETRDQSNCYTKPYNWQCSIHHNSGR